MDKIYNEYKTHFTRDPYGKFQPEYRNHSEHEHITRSTVPNNVEYRNNNNIIEIYNKLKENGSGAGHKSSAPEREEHKQEIQTDQTNEVKIDQQRTEASTESKPNLLEILFSKEEQTETPRRLPTVELGNTTWIVDKRLGELRNVNDPSDRIDLMELENSPIGTIGFKQDSEPVEIQNSQTELASNSHVETQPAEIRNEQERIETKDLENINKQDSPADIIEQPKDIRALKRSPEERFEAGW